jgi:hypothetical protein
VTDTTAPQAADRARAMILPLALAQFIASYAATNMNVAALTIMLVITLIGLVLGVLIPRGSAEAAEAPSPGAASAAPKPAR